MIMKEVFPEGLKLTYSLRFQLVSCSPCCSDIGADESQGRSPVGAAADVPVDGVADGLFAMKFRQLNA